MWNQIFFLSVYVVLVLGQDKDDKEWFPFLRENQDNETSPQLALRDRKTIVDENSPFVDQVPVGEFHLNDVVLSASQRDQLFKPIVGRSIIADEKLRWTDAVIPYVFDCSIEKLENAVAAVKAGMREWESKTCIRFKKRTNEKKYLRFIRDTHCWGHVGMHDYSTISVGYGCENQNVMSHEIGHAIGFHHEMNRMDRDSYVQVMWQNIGQFKSAFEKVKNTITVGVPYDYESIMHYPWTAFSSNGKETMRPRRRTSLQPYVKISAADARETSIMYKCQEFHQE